MKRPDSAGRGPTAAVRAARLALLAAAFAALLPACDNPACVFGPHGCEGTASSDVNAAPASLPVDGQIIDGEEPTIVGRIPASESTLLHPDSPMALVFNESMSALSLSGALRIENPATGGLGTPIPFGISLLGEGRVVLILPTGPLDLDTTYNLVWTEDAAPVDLQGQPFEIPEDRIAETFKTAATAQATVRLLGSFPPGLAHHESALGEFVAVFDRRITVTSITPTSFDVKVGGVDPPNDPLAVPVTITQGSVSIPDTRAFRWRSLDTNGQPAVLTPGAEFDVSLSPNGSKISAADSSLLSAQHVKYDIAAIPPAVSVVLASLPFDAIGIDHLTGPQTLDLQVDLSSAVVGDRLGIFLFGNSVGANSQRIALFRDITLGTTAVTVHLDEDDVDLATDQGEGRLADGLLTIAIRMQRGPAKTPVRLLDADPLAAGIQPVTLDLTRPTLNGLGTTGSNVSVFRSDLRDFSLVGRASEKLRSVEVSTSLGNNGVLPPVQGSTATGLFVAAPVLVGTLTAAETPLAFTAQIYDNALNAGAAPISGNFTQFGASGPGAALPGPSITVEVFDTSNFTAVAGARVMVHEDQGGGSVVAVGSGITDAQGKVTLPAAAAGETFVTVDAGQFDLFTFEDVPTDRLSVPLTRRGTVPSTLVGVASTSEQDFANFDRFAVDSRRFLRLEPLVPLQGCAPNALQGIDCAFGPSPIRPNLLGVTSVFAIEVPPSELSYNSVSFLRAFAATIPVAPSSAGAVSNVRVAVGKLLDDPEVGVEERAIDGPAPLLDLGGIAGLALGSLAGEPAVRVEARVRGLPGSAEVGLGVAFDEGSNVWRVRCAYPGIADGIQDTPQDLLGKLVEDGVIDPDLQLACEVRDTFGARAGRRPRFSQIGAQLDPISVPAIVSPLPGAGTGGPSFDLVFANAIPDSAGAPGMYQATLTAGTNGRRWTLWRPDQGDGSGPTRTVHVPDLAPLGGAALPNGPITATVEAFGYAGFSLATFQWSDVEREYDGFAGSVPTAFTQP